MSDRYHSLIVVLKKDTRDDDAAQLIEAILMLKGVVACTGNVADIVSQMAEGRARAALGEKIMKVIYPSFE